jgi:hypothetical protein
MGCPDSNRRLKGASMMLDYEHMVQESLRSAVRSALAQVSEDGLPGDHHFFITFRTDYAGVELPEHLLSQYPEEMTIVLQYQFWDLEVLRDYFLVTLSFNDRYERLTIPFKSIITFLDPSVEFGLRFKSDLETSKVIMLDDFRKK